MASPAMGACFSEPIIVWICGVICADRETAIREDIAAIPNVDVMMNPAPFVSHDCFNVYNEGQASPPTAIPYETAWLDECE